MPNPFFYGGRITNPANFVGRTKELQTIFSALETAHSGQLQHVQVVGERRIGKSSLLYYVTQTYQQRLAQPEKYRFVYVDLDDAHCHTLEGLLKFILNQLNVSARPTLANFQEAIEELNRRQGIYPVLCLDEFEHLTKRREQFPNEMFEAWRSLASGSKLAFVTASQMPLGKLIQQGNLTSTFHNVFIYLELGNFTEAEARTLLARNTDRAFSEEEVGKLFKLAGFHPAHLQIGAQLLYEAKTKPDINWAELKADYEKRLNQIKPFQPTTGQSSWFKKSWFLLLGFIKSIGRAILETRKAKDEISESSALWWGIIAILIFLFLVLGWIPLGWLFKLGAKWLGS